MTSGDGRLLADTISTIEEILGADLDEITVERVVVGLFFTGAKLNNGKGGVSATPIKTIPEAVCCPSSVGVMPLPQKLRSRAAAHLMKQALSENGIRRAVGIAVMNALADTCWERRAYREAHLVHGVDAFDIASPRLGERVVIVGAFGPFLRKMKERGISFTVLEKDESTLQADELCYFRPAQDAAAVIPEADVVLITGTTLINHTLDHLLSLPRPGAQVAVIGPTVGLLPDVLMRCGATILGCIRVTNPDALLDVLAEGGSGYHFLGQSAERVSLVRRHQGGWLGPGLERPRAAVSGYR